MGPEPIKARLQRKVSLLGISVGQVNGAKEVANEIEQWFHGGQSSAYSRQKFIRNEEKVALT